MFQYCSRYFLSAWTCFIPGKLWNSFLEFIRSKKTDCVFVTNEIGSGLVPDYPLGRHFRDICGRINQLVAKNSDEAYLAVSGIKVKIK